MPGATAAAKPPRLTKNQKRRQKKKEKGKAEPGDVSAGAEEEDVKVRDHHHDVGRAFLISVEISHSFLSK